MYSNRHFSKKRLKIFKKNGTFKGETHFNERTLIKIEKQRKEEEIVVFDYFIPDGTKLYQIRIEMKKIG